MCSSPKGGSTKPMLSSNVESLTGDMSSADYSNMVQRANESYEHRQQELIAYRKTHKMQRRAKSEKIPESSFFEKLRAMFSQTA
ncbi:MAG: hypothetical protein ACC707_20210 [Thiohalomonadales bacterium]